MELASDNSLSESSDIASFYKRQLNAFTPNFSLIPRVHNCKLFIETVYNFIIENYEIIPTNFNSSKTLLTEVHTILNRPHSQRRSLMWNRDENIFEHHYCTTFTNELSHAVHLHFRLENNCEFCTKPELLALLYIRQVVYGNTREHMIKTMKLWLPTVTVDSVHIKLVPYKHVTSELKTIFVSGAISSEYSLLFLYNHDECIINSIPLVNVCI